MSDVTTMSAANSLPLVIEAAITPLRWREPAMSVDDMVREGLACIDAGASIVHHHHDMRLDPPAAIDELIETSRLILAERPGTLIYTDYLTGRDTSAEQEYAFLEPMANAGVLTMFAIDPGLTTFASIDRDGRPTRTYVDGLHFHEADQLVTFAKSADTPLSLGVFEPGHLRWILAYQHAAGFSEGSVIKLYFGGDHQVDRPGVRGINFGMPPTEAGLAVYRSMIEGSGLPWIVSLYGDPLLESPLARAVIEAGGHIRVGVEDAAGMSELSNAEMVAAVAELAAETGRAVAGASDARDVLSSRAATGQSAGKGR